MSLDLVLKARKPTRVMLRPWAAMQDAAANNPHGIDYDGCFFEPFTRTSILEPDIDPANWTYGKEGYYLLPSQAQWVEGEGAFGDGGGYVAFAGDLTYDQTTPWEAYWSNSLPAGANWPVQFNLHWFPPPNSFIPQIQVWPRVDFTLWATIGGAVYFFAPLGFSVDLSSNMLTVYEYEYDSLNAFAADPTKMLQKTYQHPMVLGPMGISNAWILLQVMPIPYSYVSEDDGETYTYHDFILRSPHLKNGGFAYYTKIPRKFLSLFGSGWPGMRSMTGGGAALSIIPIKWPASGYFVSKQYSKREANTDYPSVDDVSWVPDGGSVTHEVVHPDTLVEIVGGETFQDFKIKTTLTPGTGQYETPVVYWVKPDKTGSAEDRAQDETDISDYVRIRESMSEDLIGYKAGVLLFNRDGLYNELVYQPMNELSFHICGEDRAVLYTLDPKFQWWQTQDHEALTIDWATGDFWERMKTMYVSGMPDYGGQAISTAITNYLTRLGFDPALINIDAALTGDEYVLPRSRGNNDPIAKPEDGSTADQFLADLQEKWFSNWPMYFDAVDSGGILKPRFNIDAPLDALDYSNVKRIYYLSRDDAAAALADDQQAYADGDLPSDPVAEDYTYFCQQPEVVFLHQNHKNEIWVIGEDQATNQPIYDMWIDSPSQTQESYLYFVGERRLLVLVTRLNDMKYISWYLDELRKAFGYLRRQISFTSRYDPALRAGDYIRFYNLAHVWKVISIDQDMAPGTVSFSNDDTIQGCQIEAVQWTTGWW